MNLVVDRHAWSEDELRLEVRRQAEALCRSRADLLSLSERERLVNEVLDETFGLGPLEPLMRDPEISDILINGPKTIYVERRGRLSKTDGRLPRRAAPAADRAADRGAGWAAGSTRPARWSTPGCPTAAASTPSSTPWPWMGRWSRSAASAPGRCWSTTCWPTTRSRRRCSSSWRPASRRGSTS